MIKNCIEHFLLIQSRTFFYQHLFSRKHTTIGQQIYKSYQEAVLCTTKSNQDLSSNFFLNNNCQSDVGFLFSVKLSADLNDEFKGSRPIGLCESEHIKQIRQQLDEMVQLKSWKDIDEKLNKIVEEDFLPAIENKYKTIKNEMDDYKSEGENLRSLVKKKSSENPNLIYFQSPNPDENERQKELSYFGTHALVSILLLLIRSVEKHDASIIRQILHLSMELSQQLPMKCLTSSTISSSFLETFQPLVTYISELTTKEDRMLAQQAQIVSLSFAIAKGSLKDLLPLLNTLALNKTETYQVAGLCKQLNNALNKILNEKSDDLGEFVVNRH